MIAKVAMHRHHRRARKASIPEYEALGREHAHEDAHAIFAGLTLSDLDTVYALQAKRMVDRRRRFIEARCLRGPHRGLG